MNQPMEATGGLISDLAEAEKPFLVFFKSEYCDYCKALEPAIAVISSRYGETIGVYLLDVDVNEDAANAFKDYTDGVPSVVLFFGGNFAVLKDPEAPDPYMWYRLSYLEDFIKAFLEDIYEANEQKPNL